MKDTAKRPSPGLVTPASYLFIVLVMLMASLALKVRFRGVFSCPASYSSAAYLSDCNAINYGDYDHGAFWYGLEPANERAVSAAKVLLVGNSRVQFGFSSPVTARWFGERSIPFYSLGFSHYESVTFITPILDRLKPQASAYVINADRFFAEWQSPASRRVMQDRDALSSYNEKQFWQRLHKPICGTLPFLCGTDFAVYRAAGNGMWFTSGDRPNAPKGTADGPPVDQERWPHYIDLARTFLDRMKIDRQCVVITIVPNSATKRAEAQAIAAALGVQFIAPQVDGLTTFDGSHLDPKSADRWSTAFLEAAGPTLERCARAGVPRAAASPSADRGS